MTRAPGDRDGLVALVLRYQALTTELSEHLEHLLDDRAALINAIAACPQPSCPLKTPGDPDDRATHRPHPGRTPHWRR